MKTVDAGAAVPQGVESVRAKGRVVVTGGGFRNKGAEAMLLTVSRALQSAGYEVWAHVSEREAVEASSHGLRATGSPLRRGALTRMRAHLRMVGLLRRTCAVLDVGGYQFADCYGAKSAARKRLVIERVLPKRTPVVYLAQAWGPFSSSELATAVEGIVARSAVCYARDETSLDHLTRLSSRAASRARLAPDLAWNFMGSEASHAARRGAEPGRVKVAVAPNYGIFKRCQDAGGSVNGYVRLLLEMLQWLHRGGAELLLVPHYISESGQDDRLVCRLLVEEGRGFGASAVVCEERSAAAIKEQIASCDALVGSRYHALIAALSQGIPSLSIGWSHKYEALMAEAGLPELAARLEDGPEHAKTLLETLVDRRHHLVPRVQLAVGALRQRSAGALSEALRLALGAGASAAGR